MSSPSGQAEMHYLPAIDGLRAVAIIAVLVFHTNQPWLPGGFIGVDVFFVISGYLITSVLTRDRSRGRLSLREFYLRRIQRLVPNAVLMVAVTVLGAYATVGASVASLIATHGIWVLGNLSNVWIMQNTGGYWGQSAQSLPLLHTWSLSVEEQFYLLYPMLFLGIGRLGRPILVLCALTIASFIASIICTHSNQEFAFYMLPTRSWQLFVGCVLALSRFAMPPGILSFLGWAGMALIVLSALFCTEGSYPGFQALLPTLGTACVISSVAWGGRGPSRFLSKELLVRIGLISYSLYLWHWPAIVFCRKWADLNGHSNVLFSVLGTGIGSMCAIAAFFLIERPLRIRETYRRGRRAIAFAGMIACLLLCLSVIRENVVPSDVNDSREGFVPTTFNGLAYDCGARDKSKSTEAMRAVRYQTVTFPSLEPQSDLWPNGGIVHRWGGETPRVVLLGSSHGMMYAPLIDDICSQYKLSVSFFSINSKPVFLNAGIDPKFDAARLDFIQKWRPETVIVVDRWDGRGNPTVVETQVRDTVELLTPWCGRVVLLTQVPVLCVGENEDLRQFASTRSGARPSIKPDRNQLDRDRLASRLEETYATSNQVIVVRADRYFLNNDGTVRYCDGKTCFYADDDHLSDAGAGLLRNVLTAIITEPHKND